MTINALIAWSLGTGLFSALATGIGAIPVHFIKSSSHNIQAFVSATAAGMMISASVFSLIQEGIELKARMPAAPYIVIMGLIFGALFFNWSDKWIHTGKNEQLLFRNGLTRNTIFVFMAMFIHSIPEGIAIGVGYATGDIKFGVIMALAISVHNIPEGIAISLALKKDNSSSQRCVAMSILSSIPQPIMAVPAALLAWFFMPLLPIGMGFAGGAMLYVVFNEMLPEAIELADNRNICTMGVLIGLSSMLSITILLDYLFSL